MDNWLNEDMLPLQCLWPRKVLKQFWRMLYYMTITCTSTYLGLGIVISKKDNIVPVGSIRRYGSDVTRTKMAAAARAVSQLCE